MIRSRQSLLFHILSRQAQSRISVPGRTSVAESSPKPSLSLPSRRAAGMLRHVKGSRPGGLWLADHTDDKPVSQIPGSRAVSLWRMVLSFEQQATRAELVPDDEGWYVIFSSGRARRSWPQFVSRSAVVETIFDLQGDTVARVVAYFEQCLRDLGYEPVRKASKMSLAAIAAWSLKQPRPTL